VALEEIVAETLGGDWGSDPEGPPAETAIAVVLRGVDFNDWPKKRGAGAVLRAIRRPSLDKRALREGDLVVEISGGGAERAVGRTILIDGEALRVAGGPLLCSNFCRRLRLREGAHPPYVQLALQHVYALGGCDPFQTQTTNLRNLRFPAFLAGVRLRLPPLEEQKRIAHRLTSHLAAVERAGDRLASARQHLRRLRKTLLAAACSGRLTSELRRREGRGDAREKPSPMPQPSWQKRPWKVPEALDVPPLPPGWVLASLRDLLVRSQHGLSLRTERSEKGGVPVLRMGNLRDGDLDFTDLKVLHTPLETLAPFLLRPGDLLFNRTNSPELVGKAAVFEGGRLAAFASYLIRLQLDEAIADSRYLSAWINSPWGRLWARAVRTDGVSQSNINMARLLSLPVPVPPLAEQREIVRRLKSAQGAVARSEARIEDAARWSREVRHQLVERALAGGI
jgi:type I restriction enzyme S subunit